MKATFKGLPNESVAYKGRRLGKLSNSERLFNVRQTRYTNDWHIEYADRVRGMEV